QGPPRPPLPARGAALRPRPGRPAARRPPRALRARDRARVGGVRGSFRLRFAGGQRVNRKRELRTFPMFASLIIERTLVEWPTAGDALVAYLQAVGCLAALALLIWSLAYGMRRPEWVSRDWDTPSQVVRVGALAALACYAVFVVLWVSQGMNQVPNPDPRQPP